MSHPYLGLPGHRYWRSAVRDWSQYAELYSPKFGLDRTTKIGSGGSCFAQHISAALKKRGYQFMDYEPAPPELPAEHHAEFGYGIYSARYGNVYSSRQLRTLMEEIAGDRALGEVWEQDGRFYDPMRPTIEPNGFASEEELRTVRDGHLSGLRRLIEDLDIFVFTLGLTETWINRASGAAYPMCPGTVAGVFDPSKYAFLNLGYSDVVEDMSQVFERWRSINNQIKFVITVSPVPLAATAEDRHIVTSTTYSKSVLRAAAGDLTRQYDFVDYFPSYEIVTSHLNAGLSFEPNMRNVRRERVAEVMNCFFDAHEDDASGGSAPPSTAAVARPPSSREIDARHMHEVCEEASLDFGETA